MSEPPNDYLAAPQRRRGALTASELVTRHAEALFQAEPYTMKLVGYRVPISGSRGLGRPFFQSTVARSDATAAEEAPPEARGADDDRRDVPDVGTDVK